MGFWSDVLGRSKPKQADLDALFMVPSAAITVQSALGLTPTGDGAVCYRAAAGPAFEQTQREVVELLRASSETPDVRVTTDEFGYTWVELDRTPDDGVDGLCTALHAVNTGLEAAGFGPGLLCTVISFAERLDGTGRRAGLVYLYKQGTFYPFVPAGPRQRDGLLERQLRDALAAELPVERDTGRWLAVWGAPSL